MGLSNSVSCVLWEAGNIYQTAAVKHALIMHRLWTPSYDEWHVDIQHFECEVVLVYISVPVSSLHTRVDMLHPWAASSLN